MSETVTTTEELAIKSGISLDILEQECSDSDLLALSEFCDPWEIIGRHLQLTDPQISVIGSDHRTTEEKRLASLRKWKENEAFGATFKVFTDALLACKYVRRAREVCEYRAGQLDNRVTVTGASAVTGLSEHSSDRSHEQLQTRQIIDKSKSGMASRYRLIHSCKHLII